MSLRNEPLDWDFDTKDPYLPVSYEGEVVGFFKSKYAVRITKILNEEVRLNKALKKACYDLLKERGGDVSQVHELAKSYVLKTKRPRYGTAAIAQLLKERQQELNISSKEFVHFCNSYRLSTEELNNIYACKPIEDRLIPIIARILGVNAVELMGIRDGVVKT